MEWRIPPQRKLWVGDKGNRASRVELTLTLGLPSRSWPQSSSTTTTTTLTVLWPVGFAARKKLLECCLRTRARLSLARSVLPVLQRPSLLRGLQRGAGLRFRGLRLLKLGKKEKDDLFLQEYTFGHGKIIMKFREEEKKKSAWHQSRQTFGFFVPFLQVKITLPLAEESLHRLLLLLLLTDPQIRPSKWGGRQHSRTQGKMYHHEYVRFFFQSFSNSLRQEEGEDDLGGDLRGWVLFVQNRSNCRSYQFLINLKQFQIRKYSFTKCNYVIYLSYLPIPYYRSVRLNLYVPS